MMFVTANSTYQVDPTLRRVRRLTGQQEPLPRQGPDGEWRSYASISTVREGDPVVIVWRVDGAIVRSTVTSPVVVVTD